MPSNTRSLTRAARERATARGITYTKARQELLWIKQLLDEGSWDTFEDADAYVCDPANQTMCTDCGWTWGMVCPECAKGCGCEHRCTGWRHGEWSEEDFDDDDDNFQVDCPECGGSYDGRTGYGCACP